MNAAVDLEHHLLAKGKAQRTVNEYTKWARRLARWCELEGLELATLEAHELRRWAETTTQPGRESRKQAHAAAKHLFDMLGRSDEPWAAIRLPRKQRGKPRPLAEPERVALRDTAIMVGGRKGLATLGLLQTCARPGEVAGWRWEHIDLDRGRIRWWRSKNSDWHETPLRPALTDALERFRGPYPEGFVFIGNGRPHVNPTTLWEWVRAVAATAGLADVNPRRLRATAVRRVLEVTGSIDIAAQMAGHLDVNVTRTYYAETSWERLEQGAMALD